MKPVTDFPGTHRLHLALGVRNLAASAAYYQTLLGVAPDKQRPGYVRFAPRDPSVNLTLNAEVSPRPAGGVQHYGLQVKDAATLATISARLRSADIGTESEAGVVCCHARQDKVWSADPDGNRWEIFVTTDDTVSEAPVATGCCPSPASGCGC